MDILKDEYNCCRTSGNIVGHPTQNKRTNVYIAIGTKSYHFKQHASLKNFMQYEDYQTIWQTLSHSCGCLNYRGLTINLL